MCTSYSIMLLKIMTFTYLVPLYASSYSVFATTLSWFVCVLGEPVVRHLPSCLWVDSISGPRAPPSATPLPLLQ